MPDEKRRRVVIASLLGAIGAARTHTSSGATRNFTIALVLKGLPDAYTQTMIAAAKVFQAHAPYPFTLLVQGVTGETDSDGQIRLVDALIAQRVNAIVVAPADSRALVPAARRSVQQRILTLAIDNPLDADALLAAGIRVPYVGPDDRRAARLVGDYLAHRLRPGDRVGIIEGVHSARNAQERNAGYRDAMQAAHVEIVAIAPGDWEYGKARLAAAAMLAAHPGIRALLCANDNMARGAVDAVRAAQLSGRVLITGFNNDDAIKPLIKKGQVLATLDQFAAKQAVYGLDEAMQAHVEQQTQDDLSDFIETPVVLVTKDNVQAGHAP
ncbi:substrate-binding domain-containing protein [Paraburkholderia silviterrae]|uniref:Sugar ABC transporter substrate-binding protein n=1 Tax=Paraburkholderia silviterrae TaxID=2528715 RepID=A0A4R5M2M6_9BURK|nr:substrate-binding domain-containing protein [Paraburkholderia silviterrae]TDG19817.1 sugar ABC transporter substrate-binding protein [Paraburkholderia silviterrae]